MAKLPENAADYNEEPPCGKVAAAMRFLSLQSHVAYGYVGNRAATFPLQRLGHEVWAVNTVEFSNHTGYGAWHGRTASAEQVADIVHGIEALGMLAKCDALLTGYVGDAALGDVVLDTARKVRAANPKAIWCCDPVLGDIDTGIYVKPGIDGFFRDRALPPADLITPNHFELEHLTGRKVETLDEALAAARSLLKARGSPWSPACAAPMPSRADRDAGGHARRSLAGRHPVDCFRDHAQRHGRHGGGPVHGALAGKRRHRRRRSARPRPRSTPCSRRPGRWASASCSSSPRRTGWCRRRGASRAERL